MEDSDKTAFSEAVWSRSARFVLNKYYKVDDLNVKAKINKVNLLQNNELIE